MRTVGLLINPTAGRGRAAAAGDRTAAALEEAGLRVVDVSGFDAAAALEQGQHAAAAELEALVVVGGDGTVNLGVNAVAGLDVPLGIVPAGSGNDTARSLGLPMRIGDAITNVISALDREPLIVDAGTIVHEEIPGVAWFASVTVSGLDAAVNVRANHLNGLTGPVAYVAATFLELPKFRPYGWRVTLDDVVWDQPGTLVSIANTTMIGGGMKVAPDADPTDGLFDVVIAEAFTPWQAIRVFPRLYTGSHLSHPKVHVFRSETVHLEPPATGVHPPVTCADGEMVAPWPVRLRCHRSALRILR